jgi:MoaA/NifB/PqqE/SkfB family radical SAM enzyme
MRTRDTAALVGFFARLAVKEHLRPNLPVRPLVAELFLTDNCNLRCVSCACWRHNTRGELTTAEWCDVLEQLAGIGIVKANFTGGEPLIRPDAIDLMRHAHQVGITRLHLNSNGIRLDPATLDRVLDAGVRSFNVSLDGPTGVVHDRIRGRLGAFEQTTAHLRHLISLRDRHRLKVRMNFTVMRDNVAHLPRMAELAQELQVQLYLNLVTDTTFLFRADGVGEQRQVVPAELEEALAALEQILRRDRTWLPRFADLRYMRGHFGDLVQRDLPCAESQLKLMIRSQGQIGGCWGHDATHDVRSTRLTDIIGSRTYRDDHARLFRKECVGCGSNYSLNLRWRPRSYAADLLWRTGRRSLARP